MHIRDLNNDDENSENGTLVVQVNFWDSGMLTIRGLKQFSTEEVADMIHAAAVDLKKECVANRLKALEN